MLKAILPISIAYFDAIKTWHYLPLFHYIKVFFFLHVVGRKKSLSFHGKDVNFTDGISLLASQSFNNIIMSYTFQQFQCDIRVQQLWL